MAMLQRVPAITRQERSGLPGLGSYPGLGFTMPFGLFPSGVTDYQSFTWKEWAVVGGAAWFFFFRKR